MAHKVLVTHHIPVEGLEALKENFEIKVPEGKYFSHEELAEMIADYDALIPVFGFEINRDVIEKGKNMKIIANFGAG